MSRPSSLLSPRFLLMCGFTFTVFLSAFQLFPTVAFRIRDLGGSTFIAGLYLGVFTYGSALSAPFTGAIGDRVGRRRTLVTCATAITASSVLYSLTNRPWQMLALALVHGVCWSGLLSAASAVVADLMPAHRRGEGMAYYGMAGILAISVAPWVGLRVYEHGWTALCVSVGLLNGVMAAIALTVREPESDRARAAMGEEPRRYVDWRVLAIGMTLFLQAFGHGGVTSFVALYAEANGVWPRSLFFSVFGVTILISRPIMGRLSDRLGHARVLVPCLALGAIGYGLLAVAGTRPWLIGAGVTLGLGFGSAYPILAAHLLAHVAPARRGAAFGSLLAGLDTGIGTGSIVLGYLVQQSGFRAAFGSAAIVAALAVPYFLLVDRRLSPHAADGG